MEKVKMEKIEFLNRQVDCLDKEANIIHKKLFVLLASEAGIGSLLFKFDNYLFFMLLLFFGIVSLAIYMGYYRLGVLKEKAKDINNEIERIVSE